MSMHAVVAFALMQGQVVNYADPYLNLQFDHPSAWKRVTPPRKRGLKPLNDRATFEISLDKDHAPAVLEVVRTAFNAPTKVWQEVQIDSNKQLKREVVRQWQQDVLNVPMLFTKALYRQGESPMASLTGLFYMRADQKLLLRMTCESAVYDQAQQNLMTAMESLRTIDGTTPVVEDPERKPDPAAPKKPTKAARPVEVGARETTVAGLKPIGRFTAANRTYEVLGLQPWTMKAEKDRATLTCGPESYVVETRSNLDSEPADRYLAARATQSLGLFDKVAVREDQSRRCPAGGSIAWVSRVGSDAKGPLARAEVVFSQGDAYLFVAVQDRDPAKFAKTLDSTLRALQSLKIEPAAK